MAGSLKLEFLGGLRVMLDGDPVTGFISSKVQALLCYLAVTGREQYRPALSTLFWGDQSETAAATSLRQAIANLRRLVGSHLIITRTTIAFDTAALHEIDVVAFEHELQGLAALVDGRAGMTSEILTRLKCALDRYQGDFLAGFTVRDAPAFDEWALTRQEQLRELALHGLHTLVVQYTARDDYAAALVAATRLLATDPWREEAHRQMMLLLAHTGQYQAALAQYQRCQRVLHDELGIEPMPETTALYERILASQAERRRPIVLPATSFVGRDAERTLIRQRLSDPGGRLITILGQGGAGKSRLALQIAVDHQQRFLHGVAVVPLAAVSSGELLMPAIAGALGITFERQTAPITQLIDYLREKELLLLLDNFEHLVEEAVPLVVELLNGAPQVRLLITSRERLRLQEEWLIELEGLPLPSGNTGSTDEDAGALQLFVERTHQILPGFDPQDDEWKHVHTICQLAGGLPLAIELAASAMRSFTCAEVALAMARNDDVLHTTVRNVPERQRSMRATFEYSWRLLSAAEQQVFQRVSVFRGGFEREAAIDVAGTALLPALADKSLLYRTTSGRYGVHELLRQYAEEKLRLLTDEYVATRDRHLRWVATFVGQQSEQLRGIQQQAALAAIDAEVENVRHAWQWGVERADAVAISAIVEASFQFYEIRNRFQEGMDLFAAAATRFTAVPETAGQPELVDRLLARQAVLLHRLGDYDQARELLQHSLEAARQRNDRRETAFCLNNLGYVVYDLGLYPEAKHLFEESRDCYRELDDRWSLATALTNLGLIGTVEERIAWLQQGRELCQMIGDRRTLARILNNLGGLCTDEGRYDEARKLLNESLIIFSEIGYRRGTAYTLYQLSALNSYTGDYGADWELGQRSLALFSEIGEQRGIALCHISLGILATHLHDYDGAERLLYDGLDLCKQLGDQYLRAYALDQLGAIAQERGKPEQARPLHQEAVVIAREIGDDATAAVALVSLARAEILAGEPGQARHYLLDALALAMARQLTMVALEAVYELAVLGQDQEPAQAAAQLTVVVEHPATFHDTRDKARRRLDDSLSRLTPGQAGNTMSPRIAGSFEEVAARLLAEAGRVAPDGHS